MKAFIVLAMNLIALGAFANPSSLELCRRMGAQVPAAVAQSCAKLIAADRAQKAREAEKARLEKLLVTHITSLVREKGPASAVLKNAWRERKIPGELSMKGLSCQLQNDHDDMYIICSIPAGRGVRFASCSYDSCSEETEVVDKFLNFVVDKDGNITKDHRVQIRDGRYMEFFCTDFKHCAG